MAWLLLAATWCLLLLAAAATPWLGTPGAIVSGHAACAGLLLWARPRSRMGVASRPTLLAGAAGFLSLPAWLALVGALGLGLGLPARTHPAVPGTPDFVWLAHIVLAPLFEELLYRERVLPALLPRIGRSAALVLTSALFALPHLEAWTLLATFCVGLFLGALQLARGRVGLCIGYHAGANAAVLVCGLPPSRLALDPAAAALVSLLGVGAAIAWTTRHGASRAVHGRGFRRRAATSPRARRLHRVPPCRPSPIDPSPPSASHRV
jgi:membrane protease YdiL (CAAX protease family)